MEKEVKVKAVAKYNGHSVQANGIVVLNIVLDYSELTNTIQMMQLLNNDIKIAVKYGSDKPMKLGSFRLDTTNIGSDGMSKVKFKGTVDFVETDNLNDMALNGRDEYFNIRLIALVETYEEINEDDIQF